MVAYKEKLITAPAEEPITVAEIETWLKLDTGTDTALLSALIKSARQQIETDYHCALVIQTWEFYLDVFPGDRQIVIPRGPMQSVESIKYYDTAGNLQTLSTTEYQYSTADFRGEIKQVYGSTWPTTQSGKLDAVIVRCVLGYGNASDVPEAIKDAIRLQVAFRYENREDMPLGRTIGNRTVNNILNNYFSKTP